MTRHVDPQQFRDITWLDWHTFGIPDEVQYVARPMADPARQYAQKMRQEKPRATSATISRSPARTHLRARFRRRQPASIHALMTACRGALPAPFSRMQPRN